MPAGMPSDVEEIWEEQQAQQEALEKLEDDWLKQTEITLEDYIEIARVNGDYDLTDSKQQSLINEMLKNNNLLNVEGLPYQFMDTVDARAPGTSYGRKYIEKIIARMPLLFLTPCEPVALGDFDKLDAGSILTQVLEGTYDPDLISGKGRYYTTKLAYVNYYSYLNCMMCALVTYLGLYDTEIYINGSKHKLGTYDWSQDTSEAFKTYFDARENVVFYLDGFNTVSETFTNDVTDSSIASQVNAVSDTANELKFLLGTDSSAFSAIKDNATEAIGSIASALSGAIGEIGGSVLGSFADNGIKTIANGGKIIFPQIWSNSSYSRSYSLSMKFRSPDHDPLSIFMNVLKPYCKLLCMCMPRVMEKGSWYDSSAYMSPFLVRAYSKGMFNIDMGIISSLSVTKGGEGMWNNDGLPTQIDVEVEITDLYSALAMSGFYDDGKVISFHPFKQGKELVKIVNNTSYMDFIANMAGLNIGQMHIGRRVEMYRYLAEAAVKQFPSRRFMNLDRKVSNLMESVYNIF